MYHKAHFISKYLAHKIKIKKKTENKNFRDNYKKEQFWDITTRYFI